MDLQEARDLWTAAGIETYRFGLRETCGERAGLGTARVTATEQDILRVEPSDRFSQVTKETALTVVEMFDLVEAAQVESDGTHEVTFDSELGYPTWIAWDPVPHAIDDERCLRVSNLEPAV